MPPQPFTWRSPKQKSTCSRHTLLVAGTNTSRPSVTGTPGYVTTSYFCATADCTHAGDVVAYRRRAA